MKRKNLQCLTLVTMHILIADDNPASRERARALATSAGHTVEVVDDGAAALTAIVAGDFDAALLDRYMPLMDGPTVARSVAAVVPASGRPRLIALTQSPDDDRDLIAAGFDACLDKAFCLAALAAALQPAQPPPPAPPTAP